ncbi:metal-dependent hydrolase [Arthrobacter sp. H41]|uniref:metal-dependent hydrolase n=1 Tax=Arthrobacter sp. H41 TaxID=1312978 RepID=UPI00047D7512|nr:metal-dependent hydrolase [Arthrobacter sp. H41]
MTLPAIDTTVTYAAGAVASSSTVLHVEELADRRFAVLLAETACHPVDAAWPDQGADRAVLVSGGRRMVIEECVVGATDGSALFLGSDVPVRKGTAGWSFVVAHLLAGEAPREGSPVSVEVDGTYRRAVSAGHTACHLASLALNAAVADRWKKDIPADALGSPDFDAVAIDISRIGENSSTDTYRLGRSLRRKGFVSEDLDPGAIGASVNRLLGQWVAFGGPITVRHDGDLLTDRRHWECSLPEGAVSIPCGGTHAASLADFARIQVDLSIDDVDGTPVLKMATTATVSP